MSAPTLTRASALTRVLGLSGRIYMVDRILQGSTCNKERVYLAKSGDQKYVLEKAPLNRFKFKKNMYDDLQGSPYLRVHEDTCPDESMFIYKHLRDDFFAFAKKNVPLLITKRILRDSLRGIAALHEKGITHTDINPNKILIEWNDREGRIEIEQVHIALSESSMYLPENRVIFGGPLGNEMWRSPEAHTTEGMINSTDIFSFGLVCIYAFTKCLILAVDESKIPPGFLALDARFTRLISYFADKDGLEGLIRLIRGSFWAEVLDMLANQFNEEFPMRPFSMWSDIDPDPDFRELVGRMTNFDPYGRITAKEALEHKWFSDVT